EMGCFSKVLILTLASGAPFCALGQSLVDPAIADAAATAVAAEGGHDHPIKDMTFGNFFEGWNEERVHRHRYTPDMALLRVTTNFLERELRVDYQRTDVANNPKLDSTEFANFLMAYGLSRRLMLELIANYQWNNPKPHGPTTNGSGGALLARFQ